MGSLHTLVMVSTIISGLIVCTDADCSESALSTCLNTSYTGGLPRTSDEELITFCENWPSCIADNGCNDSSSIADEVNTTSSNCSDLLDRYECYSWTAMSSTTQTNGTQQSPSVSSVSVCEATCIADPSCTGYDYDTSTSRTANRPCYLVGSASGKTSIGNYNHSDIIRYHCITTTAAPSDTSTATAAASGGASAAGGGGAQTGSIVQNAGGTNAPASGNGVSDTTAVSVAQSGEGTGGGTGNNQITHVGTAESTTATTPVSGQTQASGNVGSTTPLVSGQTQASGNVGSTTTRVSGQTVAGGNVGSTTTTTLAPGQSPVAGISTTRATAGSVSGPSGAAGGSITNANGLTVPAGGATLPPGATPGGIQQNGGTGADPQFSLNDTDFDWDTYNGTTPRWPWSGSEVASTSTTMVILTLAASAVCLFDF